MKTNLLIVLLAIGVTNDAGMRRTVHAVLIPIESASFYVSIRWENSHKCGGALLTRNLVITAESCVGDVESDPNPELSVVIATDLQKKNPVGRNISSVKRTFSPRRSLTPEETIAILVLSASIPLDVEVAPVLWPVEDVSNDRTLTAHLVSAARGWRARLTKKPLKQLEVLINRDRHPMLLRGKAKNGDIADIDEGSPLVHDGRIVGIAVNRHMKSMAGNLYADVHSYWKFIILVLIRTQSLRRKTPRNE